MAPGLPNPQRARAAQLIEFILSGDVQDQIARTGRALPARLASQAQFTGDPVDHRRARFVESLGYARPQRPLSNFAEVDRVINRALGRMLNSPDQDVQSSLIAPLADEPVIQRTFSRSRKAGE